MAWSAAGISAISSRNSVPPSAASTRPARSRTAPVKAPSACPNISLASSSSLSAGQFTTAKGCFLRGLSSCSVRASTLFPVPLSPRNSTGTSCAAARLITSISGRMAALASSRLGSGAASASLSWRSATRSSNSRRARACSTTRRICAGVNGLGR